MKKLFAFVLALLMLLMTACGQNTETEPATTEPVATEPINALATKEYDPFVFEEGADFQTFFADLSSEYANHLIGLSDYMMTHANEIEVENKGFSDFSDYEANLDSYYRFLNGVMYCDSTYIPAEYQDAWSLFKTTVWNNKADLDNLYWLRGQELIIAASDMMTYIEAGCTLVGEAFPKATSSPVALGDTIALDFVEMTLEELYVSDTILPTDTDSSYSYIGDVENEQHFCITGTLKNLSGNSYNVEYIYAEMVFDDKYTYSAQLSACAWTDNFYGESVKPLGTVKYYIHASIPDELINSWSTCTIMFGFQNDFGGSLFVDKEDCDYLYALELEHQQ